MAEERHFTVDEANALLGDLRPRLDRIRRARRTVLDAATPVAEGAEANGGGRQGAELFEALRTLRRELELLGAEGIVLRDAETGLIDFPTLRGGRLAYLCWTPEEERVRFWHEVDGGFGARKPL